MAGRHGGAGDAADAPLDGLLAAIHRENPTGRGLPEAEAARRYAEKARLQSALIRRFPEVLTVSVGPDPAVVGLDLRAGADAGHARLDALDPDARAWVRFQLDTAGDGADEAAAAGSVSAPALQDPARQAMESYDFPGAEAAWRAALPAPAAVAGLVELWVDWLADDQAALDLFAVHGHPGAATRGRVAVAAARLGARGVVAAAGVQGPRGALAWATLGQRALETGEQSTAEADLVRAHAADPTEPAVDGLRTALAARRAAARAQAEAALHTLAGPARVTAARALLGRFPDSVVARAVLRDADAAAQAQAQAAALARAERATRPSARVAALREAQALGAQVGEALEAAVAAEAEAARAAARQQAAQTLAQGAGEAAWEAWWALGPEDRAQVPAPAPVAGWIEGLVATGQRPRAAIRAAQCLAAVQAGAQPADALRAHRRVLEELPAYQAWAAAGRVREAAQRAAAAAAALQGAWATPGAEAAARALKQVTVADLPAGHQLAALAFGQTLRRRALRAVLTADFEARVAADDLLGARPVLDRLLALYPEARGLRARLAALDVAVAKAWHFTVLHPHEGDRLPDLPLLWAEGPQRLLDGHGRAVLTWAHGGYLFVRWVRLTDAHVERAVVLKLPRPAPVVEAALDAQGLRVLTQAGDWIRLAADGSGLRAHRALLAAGETLELAALEPNAPRTWLATSRAGDGEVLWRVDDEDGARSEVRAFAASCPLLAVTGRGVASADGMGHLVWWGPDGQRQRGEGFDHPVHGVAAAPAGPPWMLAGVGHGARLWAGGPSARPIELPLDVDHPFAVLAVGDVAYVTGGDGRRAGLWAVARSEAGCAVRWSVPLPRSATLLMDPGFQRAVAVVGGCLFTLDPAAPPQVPDAGPDHIDPVVRARPCSGLPVARRARVNALRRLLEARSRGARRAWVDAQVAQGLAPTEVIELYHAARQVSAALAERVAERALERLPDRAEVRLINAERLVRQGRWARASELLAPVRPGPDEADVAAHFHHLLGLSLWFAGADASAVAAWREGLAHPGAEACGLHDLLAGVAGDAGGRLSPQAQLIRAVRAADAARAAGDFNGVIAALDLPVVWALRHPQALARLAEAVLELPAKDDAAWLRKARVVAHFARAEGGAPEAVALPAERWTQERLDDLRTQARLWLSPAPATF
ncbi:MAG: hypothetical protein H6702_18465 [Myxococcales bacterium]|nr:hypothetical protein [Myxococcales bacterium]